MDQSPAVLAGLIPALIARPVSSVYVPAAGFAPAWFTLMDRNRDGYLAKREFLGKLDDFADLDRDRDGFLNRDEAANLETR